MKVEEYISNCVAYMKEVDKKLSPKTVRKLYQKYVSMDLPLEKIKGAIDLEVETIINAYKEFTTNGINNGVEEELNELFDCKITNSILYLQVSSNSVADDMIKLGINNYKEYSENMLEDALIKIYDIMQDDAGIQTVFIASPLLRHPMLINMFIERGFSVSYDVDPKYSDMFANAERMGSASIARNILLDLYRNKKNIIK